MGERTVLAQLEIAAEEYALDVLEHARLLADLALGGHRDPEATINRIYSMVINAKVQYCSARGEL